jgi:GrpB-like predicted nucleotidyltransferase (UPF0157 family)
MGSVAAPIEIIPWRPDWAAAFAALKGPVLGAAPPGARLHHIGSTAVPGLAAKDVIDLQLTVADLEALDDARFAAAGFQRVPGLGDHPPPGLDLAPAELAKRFYRGAGRPANLHVREAGRFNQRYALICRDYLCAHPVAAGAYGLIKQRLAARFVDDVEAYYDIKDPVFDLIVEGAEEWASRIGWIEPPGD